MIIGPKGTCRHNPSQTEVTGNSRQAIFCPFLACMQMGLEDSLSIQSIRQPSEKFVCNTSSGRFTVTKLWTFSTFFLPASGSRFKSYSTALDEWLILLWSAIPTLGSTCNCLISYCQPTFGEIPTANARIFTQSASFSNSIKALSKSML